jgi:hypothetical protein
MKHEEIDLPGVECDVVVPDMARGLVILVDPARDYSAIQRAGAFGDLITAAGYCLCTLDPTPKWGVALVSDEPEDRMERIAREIAGVLQALKREPDLKRLPVALLAFGYGSASAMLAAVTHSETIRSIVAIDGRPDLADIRLHRVIAPSLFLLSKYDRELHELNRWAQRRLSCDTKLEIATRPPDDIPRSANFAQLGAHATRWFDAHLSKKPGQSSKRALFWLPAQNLTNKVSATR